MTFWLRVGWYGRKINFSILFPINGNDITADNLILVIDYSSCEKNVEKCITFREEKKGREGIHCCRIFLLKPETTRNEVSNAMSRAVRQ